MPLDPDAEAVIGLIQQILPQSFSKLGVQGARDFANAMSANSPPPPEIYDVQARLIPGPRGDLPVRIYRPGPGNDLPVLVWYHGGGWTIGTLDTAEAICRALSALADCVVVSVEYGLAPENKFPQPLDDCYSALEWVAAHADEVSADNTRIAVGGDSSGANLAAAVALLARDRGGPALRFQLLAYPATEYAVERPSWVENAQAPLLTAEDVIWCWDQYLRDESDQADPRAMPSLAATLEGLPPAYILTAEFDPMRDDGENFAKLLREAGVAAEYKRYSGVPHGFFTMVGILNRTAEAIADAVDHLRAAFSGVVNIQSNGSDATTEENMPDALIIDPNKTWLAVQRRLDTETDPETRRLLALVVRHMRYEARGDIEAVVETLCESPIYRQNYPGGTDVLGNGSKDPIRELYRVSLLEAGAHRLEFEITAVVADRTAVYTEGRYRQAFPGKTLAQMGIEVDDLDADYAAECKLVILWPRDAESGMLRGEEIWMDHDMMEGIADRKVTGFVDLVEDLVEV